MGISIFNLINLIVGLIIGSLGVYIYLHSPKSLSSKIFSILLLSISFWTLSIAIDINYLNLEQVSLLFKLNYFLGTIIASLFLVFSNSYPYSEKININIFITVIMFEIFFIYLFFFSDTIIIGISEETFKMHQREWEYGKLWFIFDIYFFSCWILGIFLLIKKYIRRDNEEQRRRFGIIIIAFIVGVIPPMLTGILLPRIGVYNYSWFAPSSGFFWVLIIAYAISKHHLFNMKIIAIEFVVFTLWIFIFIRILLADSVRGIIIESSILLILIIFGILLIQNVLNGIKQRKKIEELNNELKDAYSHIREMNLVNDLDLDRK